MTNRASVRAFSGMEPARTGLRPSPYGGSWPLLVSIGTLIVAFGAVEAQEVNQLREAGRERHDPRYEPRNDPNSPLFQPNYSAADDPHHPLRREEDPGPEWDHTGASNFVGPDGEVRPGRGDGAPHVRSASGGWNWGELLYGRTYPSAIQIENQCEMVEVVTITVVDLPFIDLPRRILVSPRSTTEVTFTITTPPTPNFAGLAAGGLGAWPGFLDIQGEIRVWHPWRPGNPSCMPKRTVYQVTGHVHVPADDPDDPGDQGPREIAGSDPCLVAWVTGELPGSEGPSAADPLDCTEEMRGFAVHMLDRVVELTGEPPPARWEWLPTHAEIRTFEVPELLGFRARALGQLEGLP